MSDDVKQYTAQEIAVAATRVKEFFTEQRARIVAEKADNRQHNYLERVGYSLEVLAATARQAAASSGTVGEEDAKLRRDAEAVLTWKAPTNDDVLMFAHLKRFAKATLRLLSRHPHVPAAVAVPSLEREQQYASVAELRQFAQHPGAGEARRITDEDVKEIVAVMWKRPLFDDDWRDALQRILDRRLHEAALRAPQQDGAGSKTTGQRPSVEEKA